MLFFWRGSGFLVPLTTIVLSVLSQLLTDAIFGAGTYTEHNAVTVIIPLGLSALIIWLVGRRLNREAIQYGTEHTFMFIKMEYWSIILIGVVVVNLVSKSI